MLHLAGFLVALSYISSVTAGDYSPPSYIPPNADCHDYTVPVTVTSDNYQWTGPRWSDNYELFDFLTTVTSRPTAGFSLPFGNKTKETGSYKIGATFCTPKKVGPKSKTVFIATHGLGADKGYLTHSAFVVAATCFLIF